jgi:hypothetical protein
VTERLLAHEGAVDGPVPLDRLAHRLGLAAVVLAVERVVQVLAPPRDAVDELTDQPVCLLGGGPGIAHEPGQERRPATPELLHVRVGAQLDDVRAVRRGGTVRGGSAGGRRHDPAIGSRGPCSSAPSSSPAPSSTTDGPFLTDSPAVVQCARNVPDIRWASRLVL